MRVFVALDIPDGVRAAIGAFIAKLRPACGTARWARIEGMHVTLKFIGEIQQDIVETVEKSLAQIRIPDPIEIKFRGVGFFPNARRPQVFWAGLEAGADLSALASNVETSLAPFGIAKEQRAFSPHLTLARFASPARATSTLTSLHRVISEAGPLEFGAGVTKEFHLYRSVLKPGGAQYTRLATFRFAGGESL